MLVNFTALQPFIAYQGRSHKNLTRAMMHNLFIYKKKPMLHAFIVGSSCSTHTHVHLHININIVFEKCIAILAIHYECVHKSYVYLHWMQETFYTYLLIALHNT